VARCTVGQLIKVHGSREAVRGKRVRTTISAMAAACTEDRVNRQFTADRPNQLWLSDFTYFWTWQGWLCVALSLVTTDFVLDKLEQALYARKPGNDGPLIHHSDRPSQYLSVRYSERLAKAHIEPSVGSRDDGYESYGNALAETINCLYKMELIQRRASWKTREFVEIATLEWVAWYNPHWLMELFTCIPPAEVEANYSRQLSNAVAKLALI